MLVDTPDPYVKLLIPTSPNGKRRTKVQRNTSNPVWDESFYFYLRTEQLNLLRKWLIYKYVSCNCSCYLGALTMIQSGPLSAWYLGELIIQSGPLSAWYLGELIIQSGPLSAWYIGVPIIQSGPLSAWYLAYNSVWPSLCLVPGGAYNPVWPSLCLVMPCSL